jgi:hypothetical protein
LNAALCGFFFIRFSEIYGQPPMIEGIKTIFLMGDYDKNSEYLQLTMPLKMFKKMKNLN